MARRNMIDENQIEMVVVERPNEKGPAELVISPKLPEKAVKTKDNVSSFITQNLLDAGEQLLEMEKGGRVKKQIRTKVTFSYEGIDILTKKEFTQDSYGYHSVNLGAAFHSRHRGRRKRADYQRAAYHRNRGCHTNLRRYFGKCRRCLGIVESFI